MHKSFWSYLVLTGMTGLSCAGFAADSGGFSRLNDTGIIWSGDYPNGNNTISCAANISASQDCHQGRDALAAAGQLAKAGGGHGGFDFTRLNADGSEYTGNGDYATHSWACVQDNNTGLVWEVKTDDGGIHDKVKRYRWGGKTALGSGYGVYYTGWNRLIDGTNKEKLCGFGNWRVPTVKELESIVSFGHSKPAIDTAYFPNTQTSYYWSSSPRSYSSSSAWYISFIYGYPYGHKRFASFHVRLVSSSK